MKLRWSVRLGVLAAALWLPVLAADPAEVAAQGFDPASTVGAYTAALNNHDVDAALALFDQNGSATDAEGRTFAGRAGLTEFLLDSGFGNPDARITTDHLRVVGNRALWSYTCSCVDGSTDVRSVVNQNKITEFFVSDQPATSLAVASRRLASRPNAWLLPALPLVVGLGAGLVLAAVVVGLRRRRPPSPPSRATQGSLLASLAQSRGLGQPRASLPNPVHRARPSR